MKRSVRSKVGFMRANFLRVSHRPETCRSGRPRTWTIHPIGIGLFLTVRPNPNPHCKLAWERKERARKLTRMFGITCALTVSLAIRTTCSRLGSLPADRLNVDSWGAEALPRIHIPLGNLLWRCNSTTTHQTRIQLGACFKILEQYTTIRVLDPNGFFKFELFRSFDSLSPGSVSMTPEVRWRRRRAKPINLKPELSSTVNAKNCLKLNSSTVD